MPPDSLQKGQLGLASVMPSQRDAQARAGPADRGPREGKEEGTEPTEPRAEAGLVGEGSHWPDGAIQPETNRDLASLSTEAAAAGGASQGNPPPREVRTGGQRPCVRGAARRRRQERALPLTLYIKNIHSSYAQNSIIHIRVSPLPPQEQP